MKRRLIYVIGALAGAILLAEADTVKNGFVEVVGGADHALFLLKPDDVGVFLETNCTASAGEDGIHNVWTECKPCRHPDCRGRNPLKWMEEKKIHAPDHVEGTVRASGRILVDPYNFAQDFKAGTYELNGDQEIRARAAESNAMYHIELDWANPGCQYSKEPYGPKK